MSDQHVRRWKRHNSSIIMVVALSVLALSLVKCVPVHTGAQEPSLTSLSSGKQNILLIIGDDLGVDKVNVYAEEDYFLYYGASASYLPSTPNIDRLAQAGVRFTNAWANPYCSPTRAGFYTGRYAFRTGVGRPVDTDDDFYLRDVETTIAEALQEVGYVSGLFGKWHLGEDGANPAETTPTEQGWDYFAGTLGGRLSDYSNWEKYIDDGTGTPVTTTVTGYATAVTVSDALDWIEKQNSADSDRRWMATVAFHAPHDPWHIPPTTTCYSTTPSFDVSDEKWQYQAMVECLDYYIGKLIDGIDDLGALSNTTVIFIGDNGTVKTVAEGVFQNNQRGKGTVYETGVRVPFIVADGYALSKGQARKRITSHGQVSDPGRSHDDLVHTVDIFASVAEVAGADATSGTDSVSFLDYLEGGSMVPTGSKREFVFTESFQSKVGSRYKGNLAIRNNRYKLIIEDVTYSQTTWPRAACHYSFDHSLAGDFQLFDLATDRFEDTNLYDAGLTSEAKQNEEKLLAELERLQRLCGSWRGNVSD